MIDQRRSGAEKSYDSTADLMSILLSSDTFEGNDNLIIDEIVLFFSAGMKTIAVTTTNLFNFIHKQPEIKVKLLEEILPPVEAVKDNILEGLEYETVMEFEFLHQCFYETLRICPPSPLSNYTTMSHDTNVSIGEGK